MAIDWGTIKSLLIFFGPLLLPKAISYYRSVRAAPHTHRLKVIPLSPTLVRAIAILISVSLIFLLRTLPIFSPENIFTITQSRLQIPTEVLFNRLSSLRPLNTLTPLDLALKSKFTSLESRLLYLQFGPDVLGNCPFCNSDDPTSYLYYAIPSILTPHVFNLVVITLVTSNLFSGEKAATWRTPAAIAAVVLTVLDLYLTSSFNHQTNASRLRLPDLEFFFWTSRLLRFSGLAFLDISLAGVTYLTGTNRAFVIPPSPAEKIETVLKGLGNIKGKLNAAGVVKNTVTRDEGLRGRSNAYWGHEVRLTREMMEEEDVVRGMNDALENRLDIKALERDAEEYTKGVLGGLSAFNTAPAFAAPSPATASVPTTPTTAGHQKED
ncbi:hypothetical protein QBC40DRAFT_269852 [Triangularia verruculosa]|uniref:Uncharacterized protein n=1 Tax=Triangularia verruculosa TaxID=2587418 RepID=A0AAN6XBG9_9PEZI|nr:hypothetical protein QBC40DRAFT_269852 [Triangularia verruculosa]